MAVYRQRRERSLSSAPLDLAVELDRIAAMNIEELRDSWHQRRGQEPPEALSKDLIARALAHWLQEESLSGLDPHARKLLASLAKKGSQPIRHLKAGSVIVREFQGTLHEVLVVPGGFCWRGNTFDSLSTIARKITGSSWNGPRFFGLRGKGYPSAGSEARAADPERSRTASPASRSGRRSSVGTRATSGRADVIGVQASSKDRAETIP